MKPSQPIVHGGNTYDEYEVSLTAKTITRGNTYTTAVNLTLRPMRELPGGAGYEVLQDPNFTKSARFHDIRNQADLFTLQTFGQIDALIQAYINEKNL